MSGEKKQPWPASWPPFWRAVLHVLIAAGVGNLLWALCYCDLGYPPSVVSAVVGAEATVLLMVLTVLLLGRARRPVVLSLLAAYCLGTLAAVFLCALVCHVMSPGDADSREATAIVSTCAVYPLIGLVLALSNRHVSCWRVALVVLLGILLHCVAVGWSLYVVLGELARFGRPLPRWLSYLCEHMIPCMWCLAGIALATAITARMFMAAVKELAE